MPKQPVDYSKCVIYKIVCRDESVTECYVGHTTNFKSRKNQHKCRSKTINFKLYQMIRENGGWDNWTMTPICEYPCENLIQACIKEEECRIELQASLNSMKAYITKEERKEQNKFYQRSEKAQEYREAHKEKITEYKKEYYQQNKEQKKEYDIKYREQNKEQILEKKKEYYQQNKEQRKEYQKEYNQKNKKDK